jgi:hypothetical protein
MATCYYRRPGGASAPAAWACGRRVGDGPRSDSPHGKAAESKPARKKIGEVALVMRVPKEAFDYVTKQAGGRPRTAFVRDVLAKRDAGLARILGA